MAGTRGSTKTREMIIKPKLEESLKRVRGRKREGERKRKRHEE